MSHKPYSQSEVIENFQYLLNDMDYEREFMILGVGGLHFILRNRLRRELEALFIGLWRLNLERSFPEDWSDILNTYISQRCTSAGSVSAAKDFEERIRDYIAVLEEKRENDFSGPAAKIIMAAKKTGKKNEASLRLKMALRIRQLHKLIFDRLI